jgi:hypothetical protein
VFKLSPGLLALLAVLFLAGLPHARATLAPPRGQAFLGTFLSRQDFYNYLGYVQQAEDGYGLFINKLDTSPQRPVMFNLEWWLVGKSSALLGRRPLAAFWLLGVVATGALVLAVDRWLWLAGLTTGYRLRGLLLVFLGGGLGGLRYQLLGPPAWRSLDLMSGLFPFVEIVANPHFVTGTALLSWALLFLMRGSSPKAQVAGVALATALALSRPYDLVLLVSIRAFAVVLCEPRVLWVRRLAPLLGLVPVVSYLYWLFYDTSAFQTFFSGYVTFPAIDLLIALGPAALLAAASWRPKSRAQEEYQPEAHLLAWAIVGLVLVVARPVGFYFQALVGIGLPLLALAAIGLARLRPVFLLAAVAGMCTTTLVALQIFLSDQPRCYLPRERMAAAVALRGTCRRGDIVLAPLDVGLLALAYSSCSAYVSERYLPEDRDEEVGQFYGAATPGWRSAFLERASIKALVLPGDPGERPSDWLGQETSFRRVSTVGSGPLQISIYVSRTPSPSAPSISGAPHVEAQGSSNLRSLHKGRVWSEPSHRRRPRVSRQDQVADVSAFQYG